MRGFYIRNDYYNGINLAFMLNVRASVSGPSEAIADYVQAQRIRREVIAICERALEDPNVSAAPENRFWILATLVEASLGVGDRRRAAEYQSRVNAEAPAQWMRDSLQEQLSKLEPLLAQSPLRFVSGAPGS